MVDKVEQYVFGSVYCTMMTANSINMICRWLNAYKKILLEKKRGITYVL
jgi:hypothetical protein